MAVFLIITVFIFIQGYARFRKTGSAFRAFYLNPKHVGYLEKYFSFYQKLPAKSKQLFSRRVAYFMTSKKFIPRNMSHVSWEMKVLISASAIQLTFGFPRLRLSHFQNILVYPDSYYSVINNNYHKGEVNPRLKAIVLSWKSFVEGYLTPDGRNLGLHEMAHALHIENSIRNEEYQFLDHELLEEWELRASHTMQEIENGAETFFRSYGATDQHEFFSVAVENFFERPIEFLEKHPMTYQTLAKLLRQDPVQLENA